ncbi:MAG: hypothetical protein WA688_00605 [Thermoplasmata archaeon]
MTPLLDLLATVVGATISGLVGVGIVLFQRWYKDRRKFDATVLAPAYTYVTGLPDECPWLNQPSPPWEAFDAYHTQKIPARFRLQFKELSTRLEAYASTYNRWSEFGMAGGGWSSFAESVRGALPYLSADMTVLVLHPKGSDAKVTHDLQAVTSGLVPYILSNPGDPERAWRLLDAGSDRVYPSVQVVRILRVEDPVVLAKVFNAILQNVDAPKATKLVESMRASYARVEEQARTIRGLLTRRLGFDR